MKKRILSVLLTLCMVICFMPTIVYAETQTVDSWSGLQDLIDSNDNLSVTLSSDISWGGSSLTIPVGKNVILDLNGKTIDAQNNGTVIVVNGMLTIKNSGADLVGPIGGGAGPITGNIKNGKVVDQKAGGILVASGGKLVMNSGWLTNCVDSSNELSSAGGVYVSENAEFEMTGGIITGCSGSTPLYLPCSAGVVNYGIFTMSGNATISGSKSTYGGDGSAISNAGTFNADGGVVQTGQSCTNYAIIQNTGEDSTVFYCNVLNTGLGTISGGTYNYPVTNAGIITDGIFNGTVENTYTVTGGTFNGSTTGIYTVTFDSGVPSQIRAKAPAAVPEEPVRKGYTFLGWLKDGIQYDFSQNVTQNISLTSDWKAKTYTVKFDTANNTTVADKTVCWDDRVLEGIPNPEKKGADFKGWTYEGRIISGDTTYAELVVDDTVTSITLTAQWETIQYTITLDYDDGTSNVSTIMIAYGEEFDDVPVPIWIGYVFEGWFDERGGGKCYIDENGKSTRWYDKTENCTLYAHWRIDWCKVTFDGNGGTLTGPVTSQERKNGPVCELHDPVREGYLFTGWYKDAACTERWRDGDWVIDDMTLYAGWMVMAYEITIKLENGEEDIIITRNYGSDIPPQNPTRTGYTFIGWDKTFPTTMPAEDMTITAKWKVNQYTIAFDTGGGSEIAPIIQDYGTVITAPDEPTRTGYDFMGWDKTIPTTMPAENVTIKALWKDVEKPRGEIKIGGKVWSTFASNITFNLFFKETQTVMIDGSDNSMETVKVEYLISNDTLTENELDDLIFTAYTAPFAIEPDNEYIVYVRLTDMSGNVSYMCSEGIVLDGTNPMISGIENGKTYCEAQTVMITEKYMSTVTVNGKAVSLDENNRFVLSQSKGEQRIAVTDKAGNTSEMTVTVNNGHTFSGWTSNGDGTHTRKCVIEGCTAGIQTENCIDEDKNHKCDKCDMVLNECTDDDKDHVCDYCGKVISDHTGGKATCKDRAICDVCGKAYGELDPKNHVDLKHFPANTATKTSQGNIEYWYCGGCGKYYSDKNGTREIKKNDIITAKLPGDSQSPQTGDENDPVLWIVLMFISGSAFICTVIARKKEKFLH